MNTSSLELRWRIRSGGGGRTERRYLDFVVDGVSLQDGIGNPDHVTGLGCWPPDFERQFIEQLLVRKGTGSVSGRVPLYVCPECGDIGCGALTALVERTSEGFVWRDFAFENDYDDTITGRDAYCHIGPFLFNKTEYWQILSKRAAALSAP